MRRPCARRLVRVAIVLKPSTVLRFHRALTTRKYRQLFSSTGAKKPGPKGPSREVIAAIVDMKQRNATCFVERLIGTIRRECLDRTLVWTAADLEMKLLEFQRYHNEYRAHAGLDGRPPASIPEEGGPHASIHSYRWQSHCRGLYQTPLAA